MISSIPTRGSGRLPVFSTVVTIFPLPYCDARGDGATDPVLAGTGILFSGEQATKEIAENNAFLDGLVAR